MVSQLPLFPSFVRLAVRTTCALVVIALASGCDVTDSGSGGFQGSDPVVVDYPVAYVERPLPTNEQGNPAERDILDPAAFYPGARLVLKIRASASAAETVLTDDVFPRNPDGTPALYDVKDLSTSWDGKKLLFSMRAPEIPNASDDEQPTWNIWEYDLETRVLRQVIGNHIAGSGEYTPDIFAEEGHDVAPLYLPDGRILFSSNRQERGRAILLDEARPQYHGLDDKRDQESFALHVMDADGNNRQQITFNASQDLYPTLLDNGDIIFLRRDAIGSHNRLSLYRVKPDGTQLELYYGYHSQNTGTGDSRAVWSKPYELEDGRLLAILVPRTGVRLGGDIVAIAGEDFTDILQPTAGNKGAAGPAQVSLAAGAVDTRGQLPSLGGYFSSAYPLYDGTGRLLVSWSQCRLINPDTQTIAPCTEELLSTGAQPAPLLYGLWIYNPETRTQLPVKIPQEGVMFTDAVTLRPKPRQTSWRPLEPDSKLVDEEVGVLHIRSIYDVDGSDAAPGGGIAAISDPARTPTDNRERRFLRIVKNVPIPDDNVRDIGNTAFGASAAQGMRDIIGYVPIEPDGSAKFKVPADVPFMFDIVDARGKRIGGRHQNWLQLRPGEERECTGCHTAQSEAPHGRQDAEAMSIYAGALGGRPFPNTQLRDENDLPLSNPRTGETMAEYHARIYQTPRIPSVDLIFSDEWTNAAAGLEAGADIRLTYRNIEQSINANPRDPKCPPLEVPPPQWTPPTRCTEGEWDSKWDSKCRITIHYEHHIQPLWEADRRICDEAGNVIEDRTCTTCHSSGPANNVQVPAGQLELTGDASPDNAAHLRSYRELLFTDNEQEVVDNSLTDVVIERPTGEFETDEDGNLLLDPDTGEPIPIIEFINVTVRPPMNVAGARNSGQFFGRFEQANPVYDIQHVGFLSDDELKLIAEWLDIGGQYYNDPFVAPEE